MFPDLLTFYFIQPAGGSNRILPYKRQPLWYAVDCRRKHALPHLPVDSQIEKKLKYHYPKSNHATQDP